MSFEIKCLNQIIRLQVHEIYSPVNPILYREKLNLPGYVIFFLSLLKNIDCENSGGFRGGSWGLVEPPSSQNDFI